MTKSILPDLLASLERYLDARAAEWLAIPEASRVPTLPATSDGKVNVRAITVAIGRPQSQEQHLFRRAELRSAINVVAIEQGLKPIGSRVPDPNADAAVLARIRQGERRSGEISKLAAEQAAVIERQRRTIEALSEQIRLLEETGQVIRTAPVRS